MRRVCRTARNSPKSQKKSTTLQSHMVTPHLKASTTRNNLQSCQFLEPRQRTSHCKAGESSAAHAISRNFMQSCGSRSVEHSRSGVCSTLAAVAALELVRLPWLGGLSMGWAGWGPNGAGHPTMSRMQNACGRCRVWAPATAKTPRVGRAEAELKPAEVLGGLVLAAPQRLQESLLQMLPLFCGSPEARSGRSPSMRDSSGLNERRHAKGIFAWSFSSRRQAARREAAKTRHPRSGSNC